MDEAWERAVETALEGQADSSSAPRTLTLDGAVKCLQGRLPPPGLLERYQSLEHLSIANIGVSSLEKFPRLRNLQRLILSDNRIAGGLEFLVEAGLDSLRDLDLSNNRIQFLEDLAPLAQLRLVSLDLYECPVTRVKDYRSRVFGMIRTLRYLDKMDADENERPESDDEEEDEEDDEEEEEEDPGSGEVDGGDRAGRSVNGVGGSGRVVAIVDVDEDGESDADEEEKESGRRVEANGLGRGSHHHLSNGFRVAPVGAASTDMEDEEEEEEEDVEDDDEEEEDLVEEIDEEEGEDDDVVEVHDVGDSDDDADGVEEVGEDEIDEEDDDEEDGDGDEDEEDVEDDGEPGSMGRLTSTEGEIDGHEQGEEDGNGEIGEEDEQGVEEDREYEEGDGEDEDEEEDLGTEYLVQPIAQPVDEIGGSDFDACNEEDEDEVDDDEVDDEEDNHSNGILPHIPSSSQPNKRKRDEEDDDSVEDLRSSKHH
ncbi:acidic leucine-rich nuclear phosphoprotein 32-related protein 1 [Cocos nucifera]|uniref:Acidic leucine-rich nuclear phosphoprotein 32-related protein 1 n=1 Tax=Cocos nucifera TaxID=13894 RepID=A0A8K0NC38_COCNU|nr:acidic leucine-rich nuclear phosphoprotein 32-related protein 1 [Cocos nucifera]